MKKWLCLGLFLFLVSISSAEKRENEAELFDQVWSLVETHFYRPDLNGLKGDSIRAEFASELPGFQGQVEELINSYLERLEASHTYLFSDSHPYYYEFLDVFAHGPLGGDIKAVFGGALPHYPGILVATSLKEKGKVTGIIPGGPAEASGLLVGDQILSVAGKNFEPVESFSGQVGREVELTVRRGEETINLRVIPEDIQPRQAFLRSIDASAKIVEKPPYRLGYVRMWSYAGEVYQERLKALLKGKLSGVDGLILDLRGTWGGASPDFAALFQAQSDLSTVDRKGERFELKSESFHNPLVLLTDDTVSSGKELLAYNLQKSRRAIVVGDKTRGAVLAGAPHLLPNGYVLYLAQADVLVDGELLEGRGVFPDEYFPQEMHHSKGEDQLVGQGAGYLTIELVTQDLNRRWHLDQLDRGQKKKPFRSAQMKEVDQSNQDWLKTILEHRGWPSRELYGEKAQTAWLIAQHADNDINFQKQAFISLQKAVAMGQAPAKEAAYLEDRIRVNEGRPQIYGTQVHLVDGKIDVRELEDPDGVDERRRSVGLPSLAEYLESFPR